MPKGNISVGFFGPEMDPVYSCVAVRHPTTGDGYVVFENIESGNVLAEEPLTEGGRLRSIVAGYLTSEGGEDEQGWELDVDGFVTYPNGDPDDDDDDDDDDDGDETT